MKTQNLKAAQKKMTALSAAQKKMKKDSKEPSSKLGGKSSHTQGTEKLSGRLSRGEGHTSDHLKDITKNLLAKLMQDMGG